MTLHPDFQAILDEAKKHDNWAPRRCLTCSRSFLSASSAHRICTECKSAHILYLKGTRH